MAKGVQGTSSDIGEQRISQMYTQDDPAFDDLDLATNSNSSIQRTRDGDQNSLENDDDDYLQTAYKSRQQKNHDRGSVMAVSSTRGSISVEYGGGTSYSNRISTMPMYSYEEEDDGNDVRSVGKSSGGSAMPYDTGSEFGSGNATKSYIDRGSMMPQYDRRRRASDGDFESGNSGSGIRVSTTDYDGEVDGFGNKSMHSVSIPQGDEQSASEMELSSPATSALEKSVASSVYLSTGELGRADKTDEHGDEGGKDE
ncbi:hypothetical protein HDU76_002666 [Blyttiomyces sp. JEL0837]|nr:hypothetical protein HDU76_002666 [Blyttiomyces sp. JEL0837]